jgi:hypothetical protein
MKPYLGGGFLSADGHRNDALFEGKSGTLDQRGDKSAEGDENQVKNLYAEIVWLPYVRDFFAKS